MIQYLWYVRYIVDILDIHFKALGATLDDYEQSGCFLTIMKSLSLSPRAVSE